MRALLAQTLSTLDTTEVGRRPRLCPQPLQLPPIANLDQASGSLPSLMAIAITTLATDKLD